MTDTALPLQSQADQRAIAAIRRKNAVWRRILRDPPAALAASHESRAERAFPRWRGPVGLGAKRPR